MKKSAKMTGYNELKAWMDQTYGESSTETTITCNGKTYTGHRIFNVGTVHDDIQKRVKVEEYCEGHTGCKCSGCRELLRKMN